MSINNPSNHDSLVEIFGFPISIYTRAQAIADGALVDVSAVAKEAGFRHPTAVTAALWQVISTIPSDFPLEDLEGRLWDVIWMARLQAGKCEAGVSQFTFELILHRADKLSDYTQLLCHCGPGDTAEPVLTLGFPEDF